jgi:hypothetical protein
MEWRKDGEWKNHGLYGKIINTSFIYQAAKNKSGLKLLRSVLETGLMCLKSIYVYYSSSGILKPLSSRIFVATLEGTSS